SSSFSPNGKYYVVTNKDIGGPQISTHMDGDRIDITNPVDIAKYSLSGRNLLVTMDGVNIGKTAMYSNEDAVLAQRVGRLTSSSLDFVHQITSQKNFLTRMNELSVGNAIKHISLKQISDYAVNVPQQTSERQLIGQTLSLLDNLIAATQRRIDALEQAKKALLQRLFDQSWRFKGYSDPWEKRKLGELANIRRGASPRPIKSKKWFSQTSQVGWIRISDVTEQNGRIHQVEQHLSDAGQKKTLVLKSKHLLLSIAATVGKPVQNYIQVGVHDGFIVFMDPKFDLDFMFYFLEKYRPNWARFGQPGSQININSELVRDLVVSIPTVHEQDAVAQFIITLDNLIAATQSRLSSLELLKKSLLQDLFI
uniref:restriction endonuclease subunit S n=1 Tax=Lacticaseibacillus paracasei TaxID=1597 RepID=UPI00280BD5DA